MVIDYVRSTKGLSMSKQYCYKKIAAFLVATGVVVSFTSPLFAAGFQLQEHKAPSTAYAGAGSSAEDASINFYNAAGLTRIKGEQIVFSFVGILPDSKLTPTRVTDNTGVARTFEKARAYGNSLVPAFHYARRLSDNLVFGFSEGSPWGLMTNYKLDSAARYMATHSELRTINLSPSLAYAIGNGLSIGAGVDLLYAYAKLNSRTGGSSITRGITLADGTFENTADNWGLGFHVGLLYEITDCTRVGIQYRSAVKVRATGTTIASLPGLPSAGPEQTFGVKTNVTFPETILLSAYHELTPEWALMLDVQGTFWSQRFKELTLKFDQTFNGVNSLTIPERYRDTYRVALGTSYQFNSEWKGKLGVAYDRSPTRDEFRTARIPDSDRTWLALGVQYRLSKCAALELGYAHLFFKDASINESLTTPNGTANLQGKYRTRAHIVGLQFTWDIG